jgi:hypothetical protein
MYNSLPVLRRLLILSRFCLYFRFTATYYYYYYYYYYYKYKVHDMPIR